MAIVPKSGYTTLAFKVENADLSRFYSLMEQGVENAKLTLSNTKSRSLTANNYCWQLIGKIGQAIEMPKEDVYKECIRHVGQCTTKVLDTDLADMFAKAWQSQGIGWLTEVLSRDEEETELMIYRGSSDYDANEMRIFIDFVVAEAKGLGIETLTPREIERLKDLWKAT